MKKLDEMLSGWPMATRPPAEADTAAERVLDEIRAGRVPADVGEALFSPPLPQTADEGHTSVPQSPKVGGAARVIAGVESKMSKDRTRDRTNFQELAKLASTPAPPSTSSGMVPPSPSTAAVLRGKEAESTDSGIVDLKMIATADPGAEQRAKTTPLAAEGLFEDEAAPAKDASEAAPPSSKAAAKGAPSEAPASAKAVAQTAKDAVSAAPKKAAKKADEEKKGGGGVVIALVAVGAIAAGTFFFVKSKHHVEPASAPVAAAEKTASEPTKAAATSVATAAVSVAQVETPSDMPGVNPSTKTVAPVQAHRGSSKPAATSDPAPQGTIDPKLIANIPPGAAGGGGDLREAMKAAAGGGSNANQQADNGPTFAAGNVPQRPSQGQVAGAIGTVMPSARACLSGGQPMSRATITFQSDGTVKSVTVTGFAAGKPEEACIKTALSKAKVDPFAEATYPMTVSVRAE